MFETTLSTSSTDCYQPAMNLSDTSTVVAGRELLCCDLADGAVILDLRSGVYYGLDSVGTFIWGLIQEPRVISDITAAMLDEYAVEPERCVRDLQQLLAEMVDLKLIEVR